MDWVFIEDAINEFKSISKRLDKLEKFKSISKRISKFEKNLNEINKIIKGK